MKEENRKSREVAAKTQGHAKSLLEEIQAREQTRLEAERPETEHHAQVLEEEVAHVRGAGVQATVT